MTTIEIRPGNFGNDLNVFANGKRIARTDVFRRSRAFYLVGDDSSDYGTAIKAKDATPRNLSREPRRVLGLLGLCGLDLPADTEVRFVA